MDFQLPNKYRFLKVLGEGRYGQVLECEDVDSMQTVAIKIPTHCQIETEVSMLKMLMDHNFDQRCIIKYLDSFKTPFGEAMVFEALDISLYDYICEVHQPPVQLDLIRTVVQQIAIALDALKSIGVTHSDLKLDNIMLVDHLRQPLQLKLIDFGLAMRTSKMKRGWRFQPVEYRAPEVILGQRLSEAIDIWSLGSIMFNLVTGELLYTTDSNYESMWAIVKLFGQPADRLLDHGKKTKRYFNRTHNQRWKLKTPLEYYGPTPQKNYTDLINRLDDLKRIRLEQWNDAEAVERDQCIELMKAMLKLDPKSRITPVEVLKHPFITQNFDSNDASRSAIQKPSIVCPPVAPLNPQSDSSSIFKTAGTSPATAMMDDNTADVQPDHRRSFHTNNSSRMIAVQRATPEKTTVLEDEQSSASLETREKNTPRSRATASVNDSSNSQDSSTAVTDNSSADVPPDHRRSFHTNNSSRVTAAQRATPEKTTVFEDEGSSVSLETRKKKKPRRRARPSINKSLNCQDSSTAETGDSSADIKPDRRRSSHTNKLSRLNAVQPATTDATLVLKAKKKAVRFQSRVEVIPRDTMPDDQMSQDSTARDEIITKKKRKQKTRSHGSRFWCWMKKTFSDVACVN